MRRFVTRSVFVGYTDDGDVSMTADECIEQDNDPRFEPRFTGLYDADGNELYSVREKIKFGFVPE